MKDCYVLQGRFTKAGATSYHSPVGVFQVGVDISKGLPL